MNFIPLVVRSTTWKELRMRQVKVVTSSELKIVSRKKRHFFGGIVEARKTAAQRAVSCCGWSHIYAMSDDAGHRLLLEVYDRDGRREVIRG
jgi:hypothetical protein